jgi:hypothetical protein
MTSLKTVVKPDFFIEHGRIIRKLETLERSFLADDDNLTEVNTAGLTSKQIDEAVSPEPGEPPPENGRLASDPTNKLLLIRQNNVWRRTSVT